MCIQTCALLNTTANTHTHTHAHVIITQRTHTTQGERVKNNKFIYTKSSTENNYDDKRTWKTRKNALKKVTQNVTKGAHARARVHVDTITGKRER